MSLDKLERVLWRVRKEYPNTTKIPRKALTIAIMKECGTSPQCMIQNRRALRELGWIKTWKHNCNYYHLTNNDINGD